MCPSTFPQLFLKFTWVYVLTAATLLANQILLQHPHPWFRQLNNSTSSKKYTLSAPPLSLHTPLFPTLIQSSLPSPEPLHSSLCWTLRMPSFSILVDPNSQDLFAFTQTDTVNSPNNTLGLSSPRASGSASSAQPGVSADLALLSPSSFHLLQDMDDLLLCRPSLSDSETDTATCLSFLGS